MLTSAYFDRRRQDSISVLHGGKAFLKFNLFLISS
jgi:hypothetical protein